MDGDRARPRALGLMAAVEVVADKATKHAASSRGGRHASKLTEALLDRGLCTRVAMDCICLAPPLVTSDALIDCIVVNTLGQHNSGRAVGCETTIGRLCIVFPVTIRQGVTAHDC